MMLEEHGALNARLSRLRDAVSQMGAGFAIWDADDRLSLCNERLRELLPHVADLLRPGIGFADPEALLSGVEGEPGFAAAFAAAFEDIAARLPDELRPLLAEGGEEARSGLLDEARSIALGRLRQGRGSGGEPGA